MCCPLCVAKRSKGWKWRVRPRMSRFSAPINVGSRLTGIQDRLCIRDAKASGILREANGGELVIWWTVSRCNDFLDVGQPLDLTPVCPYIDPLA